MTPYYAKRALEILREQGFRKFSMKCSNFLLWNLILNRYLYFKYRCYRIYVKNKLEYDSPGRPLRRIWINPNKVNYKVKTDSQGNYVVPRPKNGLGKILDGEWDKHRSEYPSYILRGFIQRFEKGLDWEDTDYYKHIYQQYKKNERYKEKGYEQLEDYLNDRCKRYDRLYKNIKDNGYKQSHHGTREDPGSSQPLKSKLEVIVTIDREGNICHFDGNHRFSIARVLGINIPVHVLARHKHWQEIRDEIYNNGLSEEYKDLRDHPDLQDILG